MVSTPLKTAQYSSLRHDVDRSLEAIGSEKPDMVSERSFGYVSCLRYSVERSPRRHVRETCRPIRISIIG